jgi:hypothetical protein
LQTAGLVNATDMVGGFQQWRADGCLVTHGNPPVPPRVAHHDDRVRGQDCEPTAHRDQWCTPNMGTNERADAGDCAWAFWGSSLKGTRRWCVMSVCGDRAKVRAITRRKVGEA